MLPIKIFILLILILKRRTSVKQNKLKTNKTLGQVGVPSLQNLPKNWGHYFLNTSYA